MIGDPIETLKGRIARLSPLIRSKLLTNNGPAAVPSHEPAPPTAAPPASAFRPAERWDDETAQERSRETVEELQRIHTTMHRIGPRPGTRLAFGSRDYDYEWWVTPEDRASYIRIGFLLFIDKDDYYYSRAFFRSRCALRCDR